MDARDFPRSARILRAADFRAVFANARHKVSCRHFLLLALPTGTGAGRVGLVVSKKSVPRAVERNRVKRLIREHCRKRRGELAGIDLIVLARKDAHKLANSAIFHRLESLCTDLLGKTRRHGQSRSMPAA
ncbi:MAG: ribonuclease P protein component [Gammaproteobacteria bacterium]|nr:ribonuclease P protein component [Gammaproteobacteria bacterium]